MLFTNPSFDDLLEEVVGSVKNGVIIGCDTIMNKYGENTQKDIFLFKVLASYISNVVVFGNYKLEDVVDFIRSRRHWFEKEPNLQINQAYYEVLSEYYKSFAEHKNKMSLKSFAELYNSILFS